MFTPIMHGFKVQIQYESLPINALGTNGTVRRSGVAASWQREWSVAATYSGRSAGDAALARTSDITRRCCSLPPFHADVPGCGELLQLSHYLRVRGDGLLELEALPSLHIL